MPQQDRSDRSRKQILDRALRLFSDEVLKEIADMLRHGMPRA